jgi:hypothetical protein
MSSPEAFAAPPRLYRTEGNFRVPVLSRVSFVSHGFVGAKIVSTPEGASRLECRNVCMAVLARLLHSLNGVFHPKEISAPIITISINNRI